MLDNSSLTKLLDQVQTGFAELKIADQYKQAALENIRLWLSDTQYQDYQSQIISQIEAGHYAYLLDCFYQVIPFGTAGRRGEVGPGPNRINPATIQSSAQGHAQYLIKKYGPDVAKRRGVVLCYDVRQFSGNDYLSAQNPGPLMDITSRDFAQKAAEVYAANGLLVYIFDDVRATPELSFAIRHLKACAGAVFSASHNPPDHNGKKVYDEHGGQLIPPFDEELVAEVTQNVSEIKQLSFDQAQKDGLINVIGQEVDKIYWQNVENLSLSSARSAKIAYTPLHGTGLTSLYPVLQHLGFDVQLDPKTANLSGKFENVTFQIPNPEVVQSFVTTQAFAEEIKADIILNTDPDADRIGIMVHHQGQWQTINGNEICAILAEYVISKKKTVGQLNDQSIAFKTEVTSNLVAKIAHDNQVRFVGDLLVGFKYIGDQMNQLETKGEIDDFLFGAEESHGYIFGSYCREKDAAPAGLYLAELASELKEQGQTLIDYLNQIYAKYGYYLNEVSEIKLPGAEGMTQIQTIQQNFRAQPPTAFGEFQVSQMIDSLDRLPIVSETDAVSKNVLSFIFAPTTEYAALRVTVRPSGTEPKIKMYFEVASQAFTAADLEDVKTKIRQIKGQLEKAFMIKSYQQIGIDFPERGFLLFAQIPLPDKIKYFTVEPQLAALKDVADQNQRRQQASELLAFLGSDPLMKVDAAFQAQYQQPIAKYLDL